MVRATATHTSSTSTASSSGKNSTASSFQFKSAVAFPSGCSDVNRTRVKYCSSSSFDEPTSFSWYCSFLPVSNLACSIFNSYQKQAFSDWVQKSSVLVDTLGLHNKLTTKKFFGVCARVDMSLMMAINKCIFRLDMD